MCATLAPPFRETFLFRRLNADLVNGKSKSLFLSFTRNSYVVKVFQNQGVFDTSGGDWDFGGDFGCGGRGGGL